jgi:hypothetical protein
MRQCWLLKELVGMDCENLAFCQVVGFGSVVVVVASAGERRYQAGMCHLEQ